MNERKKRTLLKRVAPFLNEGEVARHVFQAHRGEKAFAFVFFSIFMFGRLVVATDDAILILSTQRYARPNSVIARLSRTTKIGEPRFCLWTLLFPPLIFVRWLRVNNERLWISFGDVEEVRAIDSESAGSIPIT